jgi:hypothetical protein
MHLYFATRFVALATKLRTAHPYILARDVITLISRFALLKYKYNITGNLGSTRQFAKSSQRGALGG